MQGAESHLKYRNVAGNAYDKYHTANPLARYLMNGFLSSLDSLVARSGAGALYEIGCGEGHISRRLAEAGFEVRGADVSEEIVSTARALAEAEGLVIPFEVRNIYDLDSSCRAPLMICCEVLEHVDDPERALRALSGVVESHVILSVPREPIWRALNLCRLKYVSDLGNTPGHIQHWSSGGFVDLVSRHFEIVEVRKPLPWTMVLARRRR